MDDSGNKKTIDAFHRSEVDESEESNSINILSGINNDIKSSASSVSATKDDHDEKASQNKVTGSRGSLVSGKRSGEISEEDGISIVRERKGSIVSGEKGITLSDRSKSWVTEEKRSTVSESRGNLGSEKKGNVVSETKSSSRKLNQSRENFVRQRSIKNDSSGMESVVPHIEPRYNEPNPYQDKYNDKEMNNIKYLEDIDTKRENYSSFTYSEKPNTSRANTEFNQEGPQLYISQSLGQPSEKENPFGIYDSQSQRKMIQTEPNHAFDTLTTKYSLQKIKDLEENRNKTKRVRSRQGSVQDNSEPEAHNNEFDTTHVIEPHKKDSNNVNDGKEMHETSINETVDKEYHLQYSGGQKDKMERRTSNASSQSSKLQKSESESGKMAKMSPSEQKNNSRNPENVGNDDIRENNTSGETSKSLNSELTNKNMMKSKSQESLKGAEEEKTEKLTRKLRGKSSDTKIFKKSHRMDALDGDETKGESKRSSKSEESPLSITRGEVSNVQTQQQLVDQSSKMQKRGKRDSVDFPSTTSISTKTPGSKPSQENQSQHTEEITSLKPTPKASLTRESQNPGIAEERTGQEKNSKTRRSSDVIIHKTNKGNQERMYDTDPTISKDELEETQRPESRKHSGVSIVKEKSRRSTISSPPRSEIQVAPSAATQHVSSDGLSTARESVAATVPLVMPLKRPRETPGGSRRSSDQGSSDTRIGSSEFKRKKSISVVGEGEKTLPQSALDHENNSSDSRKRRKRSSSFCNTAEDQLEGLVISPAEYEAHRIRSSLTPSPNKRRTSTSTNDDHERPSVSRPARDSTGVERRQRSHSLPYQNVDRDMRLRASYDDSSSRKEIRPPPPTQREVKLETIQLSPPYSEDWSESRSNSNVKRESESKGESRIQPPVKRNLMDERKDNTSYRRDSSFHVDSKDRSIAEQDNNPPTRMKPRLDPIGSPARKEGSTQRTPTGVQLLPSNTRRVSVAGQDGPQAAEVGAGKGSVPRESQTLRTTGEKVLTRRSVLSDYVDDQEVLRRAAAAKQRNGSLSQGIRKATAVEEKSGKGIPKREQVRGDPETLNGANKKYSTTGSALIESDKRKSSFRNSDSQKIGEPYRESIKGQLLMNSPNSVNEKTRPSIVTSKPASDAVVKPPSRTSGSIFGEKRKSRILFQPNPRQSRTSTSTAQRQGVVADPTRGGRPVVERNQIVSPQAVERRDIRERSVVVQSPEIAEKKPQYERRQSVSQQVQPLSRRSPPEGYVLSPTSERGVPADRQQATSTAWRRLSVAVPSVDTREGVSQRATTDRRQSIAAGAPVNRRQSIAAGATVNRRQSIAAGAPVNRRLSIAAGASVNRRQSIAAGPSTDRRHSIAVGPSSDRRHSIAAGPSSDRRQSISVQQYQNRQRRPSTAPGSQY